MLLENKTAIVYGAARSDRLRVVPARTPARAPRCTLAGRTESALEAVAQRIHSGWRHRVHHAPRRPRPGHRSSATAAAVANANRHQTTASTQRPTTTAQGAPLVRQCVRGLPAPRHEKAVTSAYFNIATACVGRHMTRRGRGVILVMAGGRRQFPVSADPTSRGPRSAGTLPPARR
jgi:hypothetical protein